MRALDIKRHMDASGIDEVVSLLEAARLADGTRPLNDHLWLDLREGGRTGFAGILMRDDEHGHLLGYCQLSRGNASWALDLVIHPHHRYDSLEIAPPLMRAALDVVADEGGGHVHWWVFEPNNLHARLADEFGFARGRTLAQMRRPLPLPGDPGPSATSRHGGEFTTADFKPGVDEQEWLRVNNAAFARHPEQGAWDIDTLMSRQREPWFNASDVLMHWSSATNAPSSLVGFCWTKIHTSDGALDDNAYPMGEIYVIAVDPESERHGLGTRLTIAGLEHMTARGVRTAMLYVDVTNIPACRMYERLGFRVHHHEVAFVGDVRP